MSASGISFRSLRAGSKAVAVFVMAIILICVLVLPTYAATSTATTATHSTGDIKGHNVFPQADTHSLSPDSGSSTPAFPSPRLTDEPSPLTVTIAETLTEETKEITWEVTFSPAELDTWFRSHKTNFAQNSSPFVLRNNLRQPLSLKNSPWILYRETANDRVKLADSTRNNNDGPEDFRLTVETNNDLSTASMEGPWEYNTHYTLVFTSLLTTPVQYETQYSTLLSFSTPESFHTLLAFTQLHSPLPSADQTTSPDTVPAPDSRPTHNSNIDPITNPEPSSNPATPSLPPNVPLSANLTSPPHNTAPNITSIRYVQTVNTTRSPARTFSPPSFSDSLPAPSPGKHPSLTPQPLPSNDFSQEQKNGDSSPTPEKNISGIDSPAVGSTLALPHNSKEKLGKVSLTVGKATLLCLAIITLGAALCVRRYTI